MKTINIQKYWRLKAGLFAFAALPFCASTVHAEPQLRDGAVICDVVPETGLRSVILPATWTEVSEQVVTQEAMTDLVFKPASFNLDGSLVHAATIQERVVPAKFATIKRHVVLYPETVMQINAAGELIGDPQKLAREAFYSQLATSPATQGLIVENTEDPWDRIFRDYVGLQYHQKSKLSDNIKRKNSISTQPRVVEAEIDWIYDLSLTKIDKTVPISFLIEPTSFRYPTDEEVVAEWDSYAARYANMNAVTKKVCDGTQVLERFVRPPLRQKTYEDIGVKVPRIETIGKIRTFNIHGAELK